MYPQRTRQVNYRDGKYIHRDDKFNHWDRSQGFYERDQDVTGDSSRHGSLRSTRAYPDRYPPGRYVRRNQDPYPTPRTDSGWQRRHGENRLINGLRSNSSVNLPRGAGEPRRTVEHDTQKAEWRGEPPHKDLEDKAHSDHRNGNDEVVHRDPPLEDSAQREHPREDLESPTKSSENRLMVSMLTDMPNLQRPRYSSSPTHRPSHQVSEESPLAAGDGRDCPQTHLEDRPEPCESPLSRLFDLCLTVPTAMDWELTYENVETEPQRNVVKARILPSPTFGRPKSFFTSVF